MPARVSGSPEVADVHPGFHSCQAAIARRFHSSTSAGSRRRGGPDRSCTTALRTGRITPSVISPYVQHMLPCIFAGNLPIREDYLLFTQTVQSNYCAKYYDAVAKDDSWSHFVSHPGILADLKEISMKNDIHRGAVKWDLVQKPNRILKDTNKGECENLPLSDRTATGLHLNPNCQSAKHSKIGVCLCALTCPWEPLKLDAVLWSSWGNNSS